MLSQYLLFSLGVSRIRQNSRIDADLQPRLAVRFHGFTVTHQSCVKTMMNVPKEEAGFSLLEVAIAMSTIAILSFGVMFGFTISTSQDRDAYEFQRSQAQAQELIEQAESFSYGDLFNIAGAPMVFTDGNLTCTITVTQIQADLVAIVANVQTTAAGTYQVTLTTLKTLKQESL